MASRKKQLRERPKTYWEPHEEQETNLSRAIDEQWEWETDKGTDPLATFMGIVKKAALDTLDEKPKDAKKQYITKETWDKITEPKLEREN
jgi:hypothetical protein